MVYVLGVCVGWEEVGIGDLGARRGWRWEWEVSGKPTHIKKKKIERVATRQKRCLALSMAE